MGFVKVTARPEASPVQGEVGGDSRSEGLSVIRRYNPSVSLRSTAPFDKGAFDTVRLRRDKWEFNAVLTSAG